MQNTYIKRLEQKDLGDFWEIVALAGSEGYYPEDKQRRTEWFNKIMNECEGFGYFGAFRDEIFVGGMAILDYKMNLRSSIVNLAGVGMVHTDMLRKKEKICKDMMTYFIHSSKEKGTNILYLSPFRPDFYKKMGFGYGTSLYHYRISPTSFPKMGSKENLIYANDSDKQDFIDCCNRIFQNTHGSISNKPFFLNEKFGSGRRIIAYKNKGEINGALIFSFGGDKEMIIEDMFYENAEVLRAFCAFLHSQSDQFNRVLFSTTDEYFYYILQDPTDGLKNLENYTSTINNMFRVINVAGLFNDLKTTNFNNQNAVITIKIHDNFYPENNGSTTIEFINGKANVLPISTDDNIEMCLDIADFSSLMVGSINIKTLYRLGLLKVSNIENLDLLEKIFGYAQKPLTATS